MKNIFNLLECSLNLRSDKTAKPYINFNRDIKKLSLQPDIIFLTETVKDNDFVIDDFIKVAESDNVFGNTNTILIREELIQNNEIKIIKTYGHIPNVTFSESPCFAQADIKIGETLFNLIAIRIKITFGNSSVNEYIERRKQFEIFMDYISNLENPIIMGDFNHGRILGDENATSVTIKNHPKFNNCSQCLGDYFYQSIKESFAKKDLSLCTPAHGISCGISFVDGRPDFQENPNWNHKIDHLISNLKYITITEIVYDWDFLKYAIQEHLEIFDVDYRGNRKTYKKGFPDHAMLLAQIELKNNQENGDK